MISVLVIGARGAVGSTVVSTLRDRGHHVTPAGRRAPAGGIALDLGAGDLRELTRAAREHDVIVNASGVENTSLGEVAGNAVLVDISATGSYLAALASRSPKAPIVLGAGIAPGVSTVLLAELDSRAADEVDVAVTLGSGEKHGAQAVEWTAGLLGAPIADTAGDGPVDNFREHRHFDGPRGRRRYLRADFPDQALVGGDRGLRVRSWLALTSPVATYALELVGHAPRLGGLVRRTPAFGSSNWEIVAMNRRTGEARRASGIGQSRATALVTALAATRAAENPPTRPVALDAVLSSSDLAGLPGIDLES